MPSSVSSYMCYQKEGALTDSRVSRGHLRQSIFRAVHKKSLPATLRCVRAEIFISVNSSVFLDFFHLHPDRMNNHLHALLFL